MDKKEYYNSVTDQVRNLDSLVEFQAERCFDLNELRRILPAEDAANIRRVVITGCGDSYSASGAMLPGFKKLSGLRKCNSPDIVDFCRFYSEKRIKKDYEMNQVLLISISFSGNSGRVVEALERANSMGMDNILITRTPNSKGGETAKRVFDVATPDGCNTPGLRSYYASMIGILALGAYLGLCNGNIDETKFLETKENIKSYTHDFMKDIEAIDDQMFQQAVRMKDLTRFELIADWNEGYSAQFIEEKFIECGGVFCEHTNSEEFAHISFMYRSPAQIGTMVIIHEADTSMSRMKDTINGCLEQHRPTIVVTDSKESFQPGPLNYDAMQEWLQARHQSIGFDSMAAAGKPEVCRVAKAPYSWLSPLMDFVPGALLAGYQAAVNENKYFGGRYDFRAQTWGTN